jgi:hypothetical protein
MNRTRLAWIVAALALAVMVFAPSAAESQRLVVRLDEPFEIGGAVFPPSRLIVRSVRAYTPTTLLSEIWVGGECLGLFRATKVPGENARTLDTVDFERSAAGRLTLVGFAVSGHAGDGAYRFDLTERSVVAEVARR